MASSFTQRNTSLRTITRNALRFVVMSTGAGGLISSSSTSICGAVIFSHSSMRLESVWRTNAPSHSMMSVTCSERPSAGIVCSIAL